MVGITVNRREFISTNNCNVHFTILCSYYYWIIKGITLDSYMNAIIKYIYFFVLKN